MKGSEDFRLLSQSYLQFRNEIYLYDKILPYFDSYLRDKVIDFDLSQWLPKTYLSICQRNDDSTAETILVQENIQKNGFFVEPSLDLTEEHLNIMIECLAQFHAVSLALKIDNTKDFLNAVGGIQSLCFEQPNDSLNMYDILHEISTTRLFGSVFSQDNQYSCQFMQDITKLNEVVGDKPVKLLDRFRQVDDFAVIGHGDYHRNNLLFKKIDNCVVDMKMIDFQQIRYGSPCLDLAFFMYLNISAELRKSLWDQILQQYHRELIKHTADLLHISSQDTMLACYRYNIQKIRLLCLQPNANFIFSNSYEKFIEHCKRFFLYGALISASFTPWLLTNKSETDKIVHLFQKNMCDQEYRKCALVIGGEAANKRIIGNMIHASEKGYMKILYDEE